MLTDKEKEELRQKEASLRAKASGHTRIASQETGEYKYKFVGKGRIQRSGVYPVYRPTESGRNDD